MIKTIEETDFYYSLQEVDDNFSFTDENGNDIFSDVSWDISTIKIGKKWPIEGIIFGNFGNFRKTKPVNDERVIEEIKGQIEKWSPHDEDLAEEVLDTFDRKDEFGSLFDLPDEVEAYFRKDGEKLVLFYDGEDYIDPDKDILWPANSISIMIVLYWMRGDEVQKRLWHKNKDKPRFPERKPKWTKREVFDVDSPKGIKSYGEDVGKSFSNGTYRCVGLQR